MQWTLLRGLSYLCLTEPAPAPRWTMPEESSFHVKTRIPPTRAAPVEHVKRAVYQGGHICGKTLLPDPVLPSPTDWGWVKTEGIYEPTGQHCHKHLNPAMSWSLVAARVVAESAAGARRLHFSAQASASVRENVPADSMISHLLKHCLVIQIIYINHVPIICVNTFHCNQRRNCSWLMDCRITDLDKELQLQID